MFFLTGYERLLIFLGCIDGITQVALLHGGNVTKKRFCGFLDLGRSHTVKQLLGFLNILLV